MHYLVTGATGFIGSHLTRHLVRVGKQVSVLVQHNVDRSALVDDLEQLDAHEVDLRTAGAVSRAIDTIDPGFVFHLAAAGVTDPFLSPDEAIRTNVYGTLNLLRAVKGRARIVVVRTPGEIDALNVYAASKAATWQFCRMYRRTHGWPLVGAMPFQVYGPGQTSKALIPSAIEAALAGRDFALTSGRQQRDWVFVEDVVDALIALSTARRFDFDSLDIGTGATVSVRDVVETIFEQVGRGGKPLIGALPDRPGEVETQCADAETTMSAIGWRAKTSLVDGLRATIAWMQK